MSRKVCLKILCPFEDCEHHFHRPVEPAESEFIKKVDCKDFSLECCRYQRYYKESVQKSVANDLALIQHLRSGKW